MRIVPVFSGTYTSQKQTFDHNAAKARIVRSAVIHVVKCCTERRMADLVNAARRHLETSNGS